MNNAPPNSAISFIKEFIIIVRCNASVTFQKSFISKFTGIKKQIRIQEANFVLKPIATPRPPVKANIPANGTNNDVMGTPFDATKEIVSAENIKGALTKNISTNSILAISGINFISIGLFSSFLLAYV